MRTVDFRIYLFPHGGGLPKFEALDAETPDYGGVSTRPSHTSQHLASQSVSVLVHRKFESAQELATASFCRTMKERERWNGGTPSG